MSDDNEKIKTLRELNVRAWNGEDVIKLPSKLDSSLKKNTAFIKKIKTSLNHDQAKHIIKDIETLSLEKYLSEINQQIYESLVKLNKYDDVLASVDVISKLHQRFKGQFTRRLLIDMTIGLLNIYNEDEESIKLARQKNLLRCFMELTIVGIFRTIKDIERSEVPEKFVKRFNKENSDDLVILFIIKDLMQFDLNNGTYLLIFSSFLKRYYPMLKYFPTSFVDSFKSTFDVYTSANLKVLGVLNSELNKLVKYNNKTVMKYGKTFEDREVELKELRELYDLFYNNVKYQCEILGTEFPELIIHGLTTETEHHNTIEVVKLKETEISNIWESKEEEKFYTEIPTVEDLMESHEIPFPKGFDKMTDGEKISQFIKVLDNVTADEDYILLVLAFNSCNSNNKATKNRIFRFLVDSNHTTLFKVYAKFLKVNKDRIQDLVDELLEVLEAKVTGQIFVDKLSFKYLLFYIEMIKFKLIPSYKIFHKIRLLALNLHIGNNIDILNVLFEKCGRFLLYDVDYRDTMLTMIEILKEQKKSPTLRINQKSAVANLILILEPPTASATLKPPKYSTGQQFLIRLVKNDLTNHTIGTILDILQKYDLTKPEYNEVMVNLYCDFELVNASNLRNLVVLLRRLLGFKENKFLLVKIIDELVENITRGVELNDYRMNRQRILHMKIISQIFNESLVSFSFLIDLSYKILNLGHANNQPLPFNYENKIDAPNNFFKIQLICVLFNNLDNILYPISKQNPKKLNEELMRVNESSQKKLTIFLVYFQYYMFCKEPIPFEIEFNISDLFNKVSSYFEVIRYQTLNEVLQELKVISQSRSRPKPNDQDEPANNEVEEDVEEEEEEEEEEGELEQLQLTKVEMELENDKIEREHYEDSDSDSGRSDSSTDESNFSEDLDHLEETDVAKTEAELKYEADLEKEFNKLIFDSYSEAPRLSKKTKVNIAVPKIANKKFNLLVKDGKKNNLKQIAFNDEVTTKRILREQEQRKAANERTMRLVSEMD